MKKGIEIKLFTIGIIIYLIGLFLLLFTIFSGLDIFSKIFNDNIVFLLKMVGGILFFVGFIIFICSLSMVYKNNYILDRKRDLVVEGKADIITIIVMYFVLLIMLVICLIFNEYLGALLFGIVIIIQGLVNSILVKYYGKGDRK